MIKRILVVAVITLSLFSCNNNKKTTPSEVVDVVAEDTNMYLFIGTYTATDSKGIYVYQLDTVSGDSKFISTVEVANPSYLAVSADERFVYAVSENSDNTASANAFSFDKEDGTLKLMNSQPTGGADPCFISVDNTGKHIVTANYSGGSITVFKTEEDGSLASASQVRTFTGKGKDSERQKQPYLHCVKFSPDGNFLFADDLGTDKIYKFEVNNTAEGDFLKIGTPPFFKVEDESGPRHLEFHPNGKYAYLITELSGKVIAFNYNNGVLTEFQSVLADTLGVKGSGDIHITPNGKYLYASNRLKGDGLAIFEINQENGTLTKVGYQETGIHPRNFVITPNGKFLLVANRDTNNVQVFEINYSTGLLTDMKKDIQLSMPVCLKFASLK